MIGFFCRFICATIWGTFADMCLQIHFMMIQLLKVSFYFGGFSSHTLNKREFDTTETLALLTPLSQFDIQPLVETGGVPVAIILSVGKAIAIAFPPITQLIKVVRSLKSDNPEKEEKHQRHQNQD